MIVNILMKTKRQLKNTISQKNYTIHNTKAVLHTFSNKSHTNLAKNKFLKNYFFIKNYFLFEETSHLHLRKRRSPLEIKKRQTRDCVLLKIPFMALLSKEKKNTFPFWDVAPRIKQAYPTQKAPWATYQRAFCNSPLKT